MPDMSMKEANQQLNNNILFSEGLRAADKLIQRGYDVRLSDIQKNVWYVSRRLESFTLRTPQLIQYERVLRDN